MAADGEASAGGVPIGRCASAHVAEDSAAEYARPNLSEWNGLTTMMSGKEFMHASVVDDFVTVEFFRHSQKQSVFHETDPSQD